MQNRFPIVLSILISVSSTGQAVNLTEWPLPGGSPLQIDAASPSRRVYFVDQAMGTINELNPAASTLTSWPAPFSPSIPGSIVVDNLPVPNFVYVTDLPANSLGQLDLTTNMYFTYNLATLPWNITGGPRQLVYDSTRRVEFGGDAIWFSASGTAGTPSQPIIGYFAPATFQFFIWTLPASVALPGEAIDGLAFNLTPPFSLPSVYFTVNGTTNNKIAVLYPFTNVVKFWTLPATYSQPVPIVATTAGDVFRVQCAGCSRMARISTSTNVFDEWSSADATDTFLTLDQSLAPRFTAMSGPIPTADLLVTPCPMQTTSLLPDVDYAVRDFDYLSTAPTPSPPTVVVIGPITSALTSSPTCPFFGLLPISSGGPLSTDVVNGAWISETAFPAIATFP